jgi:dihydrolipoamide dehydrogenase
VTYLSKKIVIVGGGPGGYAAAIRAAQLGASVTLAEMASLGGTCLNVGCIPTKALLHVGDFYRRARLGAVPGVRLAGVTLDWPEAQRHKEHTVARLTGGVAALLAHSGVTVMSGAASLLPGRRVRVGNDILEPDAVIIATGSVSAALRLPGADLPGVIDSTGALALEAVPASMVIVGGGVVGVEFASLFAALGTAVTVVELLPEILPAIDGEIAGLLREALADNGVQVRTGATLSGIEKATGGLAVRFEQGGASQTVTAELVLMAAGRRPNTAGLGLEEAGVGLLRGAVQTDGFFLTPVPGVYAVGDCNGQSMLAHAAMAQGVAAAEHIMGIPPHYDPKVIPSCVYAAPEAAAVGMTERQARDAGFDVAVGRFDLSGNARALIEGGTGLVKIIADKRLGEVLGVHIIGPHATELIAEAALCMGMEGTAEDIARTVHAHPTVGEAVCEAAMSVFGRAIHGF